jgi:hypothetical protein
LGTGTGIVGHAVGGFAYGMAVKSGLVAKLPPIPIIGRTGAAAILLDYWAKHGGGQLARSGATAAAVIAGYQMGSTGSITGDETMGMDTMGMNTMGDSYAEGDMEGDLDGDMSEGDFSEGDFSEGDGAEGEEG